MELAQQQAGMLLLWLLISVLSASQVMPTDDDPEGVILAELSASRAERAVIPDDDDDDGDAEAGLSNSRKKHRVYGVKSDEEGCYGKDYKFSFTHSAGMRHAKVFFTPTSPPGPTREVLDRGKALDPLFAASSVHLTERNVRILEMTTDYEGEYTYRSPMHTLSIVNNTVHLSLKDCSTLCQVNYGGSYAWSSYGVSQIDYSLSMNNSNTKILWSRSTNIPNSRTALNGEGDIEVTDITPKDEGYFTFRDKKGKFIKKYRIQVQGIEEDLDHEIGDDLYITFPVHGVRFSLTYQREFRSEQFDLVKDGDLMWSEMFDGRIDKLSTAVIIRNLKKQDGGTYDLRDSDDRSAKRLVVTVHPRSIAEINYVGIMAGAVIVVVIFLCCCGKRCLFKRENNPTSSPATQVYLHDVSATTTTNGERQRQPYSLVVNQSTSQPTITPLPSAARPQPETSYSPSPPPPYSSVVYGDGFLGASSTYAAPADVQSCAAGEIDAPTINLPGGFDCLSSGSKFDVPTGPNPSAPPLSSDTPSYDVYTSDKLNFR